MDWLALIQEIGGGLSAAVIVGLVFFCWRLYLRGNKIADERLNDVKEHSKELRQVADGSRDAINGLTRVLEDRRNV